MSIGSWTERYNTRETKIRTTKVFKNGRKRVSTLNVHISSLHLILHKDLRLHPYKLQLVSKSKPQGCQSEVRRKPDKPFSTYTKILFSNKAHFHGNGQVRKQNCRYWSVRKPECNHQERLHSPKVTVWAAMSAPGIIGPNFFEDERRRALNWELFVEMVDVNYIWRILFKKNKFPNCLL